MASSDGVGGRGNGDRAQDSKSNGETGPAPVEISVRGRIVIRSSSHPPGAGQALVDDPTGVQFVDAPSSSEASEPRSNKSTPAERPRRRRQVQAALRALSLEAELAGHPSVAPESPVLVARAAAVLPQAQADSARSEPLDVEQPPPARAAVTRAMKLSVGVVIGVAAACAIAWAWLGR